MLFFVDDYSVPYGLVKSKVIPPRFSNQSIKFGKVKNFSNIPRF